MMFAECGPLTVGCFCWSFAAFRCALPVIWPWARSRSGAALPFAQLAVNWLLFLCLSSLFISALSVFVSFTLCFSLSHSLSLSAVCCLLCLFACLFLSFLASLTQHHETFHLFCWLTRRRGGAGFCIISLFMLHLLLFRSIFLHHPRSLRLSSVFVFFLLYMCTLSLCSSSFVLFFCLHNRSYPVLSYSALMLFTSFSLNYAHVFCAHVFFVVSGYLLSFLCVRWQWRWLRCSRPDPEWQH